jgi:hypothetical protein
MIFSPTVVFCPHQEVASKLHTIEYGLEADPPWGRTTGWVGPVPENFFLNENHPVLGESGGRVLPSIPSHEAAGDFYFSLQNRLELDLAKLDHEVTIGTFRILIILEGNERGLSLDDTQLNDFRESITNFCVSSEIPEALSFEVLFLILQDKALSKKTINVIEEINSLVTSDDGVRQPRCHAQGDGANPPKVLLATTWDQYNRPTTVEELRYLGATIAHLSFVESNWPNSLLNGSGWIDGRICPVVVGLRAFFWERIRAIDLSRKKHFKECFVQKWLDQGWVNPEHDLPKVSYGGEIKDESGIQPDRWGCLHSDWNRELWRCLKTLKKEEGQATDELEKATSIGSYQKSLQNQVFGKINTELNREMEEARGKGKPKGKAVRRILNVITLLTKNEISDKFKLLHEAADQVKEGFDADFDKFHQSMISSGTGLSLLMTRYRNLANELEMQSAEFAHDKRTDFKTTDIMRFALGAIVAQLERPHGRTLKTSWALLFAFFAVIFFNLFEMLRLSDTIISPIIGIAAPMALFYLIANYKYDGRLKRIFSGIGWGWLLLFPPAGYGVYFALTNYPIGNFAVHISAGMAVALCFSLGLVAYHLRTTLHDYERRKNRFTREIKMMVEAIVNHKMVSSIREVMSHAREVLQSKANEIEKQIEEANQQLETYYSSPEGYPEAPTDLELVTMLNPATSLETRETWEKHVRNETIGWAEAFWRDDELRPNDLGDGDWWYRVLQRISDNSHRRFLLDGYNRVSDHNLGEDERGLELWYHMKKLKFRKQPPLQAYIQTEEIAPQHFDNVGEQIWAFHPDGKIAEEPDFGIRDHYEKNYTSKGTKKSITNFYNPSLVCFLYLSHGYTWDSIAQVTADEKVFENIPEPEPEELQ